MTLVYIALGANINNPIQQIQSAIKAIHSLEQCPILKISSLYKTKPIGPDQPDMINAVIAINTLLSPHDLLRTLQRIEHEHKRERTIHWGPRSLDLDILLFGEEVINEEVLIIPHPRMHERNFVLIPLHEIAGDLSLPNYGAISLLIQNNDPSNYVIPINSTNT